MLPKSIAEHLKQNGVVSAEMFSCCTIFQSDMVGFTKLSSNSSPFQVTVMLNSLFSCFDNRIGLYDVYKVETVGDGYLVVSGDCNSNTFLQTQRCFESIQCYTNNTVHAWRKLPILWFIRGGER